LCGVRNPDPTDSQQLLGGQPAGVGRSSSQEPAKELLLSALLKLCAIYCGLINKETQMMTGSLELLPCSSWAAAAGLLHHEKQEWELVFPGVAG